MEALIKRYIENHKESLNRLIEYGKGKVKSGELTESEYKSFTAWIGYELENNAGIYDRIAYEELVFIKQRLRKEG